MPRSLPRMPGRRTADHGLVLPARTAARLREDLPSVAEQVVAAIIEEVPAYETAMAGSMGDTIRNAVQHSVEALDHHINEHIIDAVARANAKLAEARPEPAVAQA